MTQADQSEPNGNLLAAVLEALCHPSVRLSSVLPILRDRDCEPSIVLTKQCSMEDASPSAATAATEVSEKSVELVALMEERIQVCMHYINPLRFVVRVSILFVSRDVTRSCIGSTCILLTTCGSKACNLTRIP